MPFAAFNRIAQDSFTGSIEITEEQYLEGLNGLTSGMEVIIEGGFRVAAPVPPEPEPVPDPTTEELIQMALAQRDQLLTVAAIRIAPLADAVELGEASEAEVALLKKWKQYRVLLNRIDQQAGFPQSIDWPEIPA